MPTVVDMYLRARKRFKQCYAISYVLKKIRKYKTSHSYKEVEIVFKWMNTFSFIHKTP